MAPCILAVLLGLAAHAADAQRQFSDAAMAAVRATIPGIADAQIHLLAIPNLKTPFETVRVSQARFHRTIRQWQLRLSCVPETACIPTTAIISSSDPKLLPTDSQFRKKQLLVHPGERKQLIAQSGVMRLRMLVTCLQAGAEGDQVRVREINGSKLFLAIVQPDTSLLLRRSL